MNFKDQWATDEEGNQFLFTVEMQRQLADAGLPVEPESLSELDNGRSSGHHRSQQQPKPQARAQQSAADDKFAVPVTLQIDPQTGKYIGRVKWYNERKGYGFIVRTADEEIFFHKSGSSVDPGHLDEGDWVLYDVEQTQKGPEATEVEPYKGELPQLA
jgi:cold shock protein